MTNVDTKTKERDYIDLTLDSSDSDSDCCIMELDEDGDDDDVVDITEEVLEQNNREQRIKAFHCAKLAKQFYNNKNYHMAVLYFNRAIDANGSNYEYFYYKSMAQYNLAKIAEACKDALEAIELAEVKDKVPCLMWLLQMKLEVGEVGHCKSIIEEVEFLRKEGERPDEKFRKRQATVNVLSKWVKALDKSDDANKIIEYCGKALEIAQKSVKILLIQANAYMGIDKILHAKVACGKALEQDHDSFKALIMLCRCHYQSGDIPTAKNSAKEILSLPPTNGEQKATLEIFKEFARNLYVLEKELQNAKNCMDRNIYTRCKNHSEAKISYAKCIKILESPHMENKTLEVTIYLRLGEISKHEGNTAEGMDWCNKALERKQDSSDAYVLRGDIEMIEDLFKDALMDYSKALSIVVLDDAIQEKYKTAAACVKFPDYYKILGVNENASQEIIKSVFKRLLLKYHPDKNSGASQTALDIYKKKFESVMEANGVVSDPHQRQRYDNNRMNRKCIVKIDANRSWKRNGFR